MCPPAISKRSAAAEKLEAKDVVFELGGNLYLIPSRLELSWTLKNPASKEHLLAGFLKTRCAGYDLTLIDCPPTESILTTAAYLASNFVLVPVKPEFLSTIGLPLLGESLRQFGELYGKTEIEVAGIVFNSADPYKGEYDRSKADVTKLAQGQGPPWYVFKNEMRYSASYAKGARTGEPISWTSYTRWWVKEQFTQLAGEFCTRVGL
jgi:chromosome partitioning protein